MAHSDLRVRRLRTLAQLDPPERLFQRPASLAVARFLGIPNLVAGSMAEGHFVSVLGRIPLPDRPPAGPAAAAFGSDALYPEPSLALETPRAAVLPGAGDV